MTSTAYPLEERARYRDAVKRMNSLGETARLALARGEVLSDQQIKQIEALSRTTDALVQPQALFTMAQHLQDLHMEKLYPIARDDFRAFCEVVDPAEPPSGKWLEFLTGTLEQIELDPEKNRFCLNCPPGHAKPLHIDTPVLMADGSYLRLGDIEKGDRVVSHTGEARTVTAIHKQGVLPLLKIETVSGRLLYAAPDHSFRVTNAYLAGGPVWLKAEELKPGMELTVRADAPELPEDPNAPDLDMAELAAFWCAYGTTTTSNTKGKKPILNPVVWLPDRARALAFKEAMARLGRHHSIHPVNDGAFACRIAPSKSPDLIDLLGLDVRASERRAPEFLFAADLDVVERFLTRFISERAECPNRYTNPRLICYMRSAAFATDLQRLLATLGIGSQVVRPDPEFGGRPHLILHTDDIRTYLGAGLAFESALADRIAGLKPITPPGTLKDSIRSVETAGEGECRCLTVEVDHTFCAEGIVVHNSTYASRRFVAWRLGRNPDTIIVAGGHSQKFVENEFSARVRSIVAAPAFQKVFPGILIDSATRAKDQWAIAGHKGQYVAKGVGQAIHGFRANFVCVDDPFPSIKVAESPTYREEVRTWFLGDIETRLTPHAKVFLIMTRFHENDLTGSLHEVNDSYPTEYQYQFLEVPAICYNEEEDPLGRRLGEILWEHFSLNDLAAKKIGLKYQRFALVYQQLTDAASEGSLAGKFKYYKKLPHLTQDALRRAKDEGKVDELGRPKVNIRDYFRRIILSVDTASKPGERNDFSVVQVWGETHDRKYMLIHQDRAKPAFPQLIELIERNATKFGVDVILIEDKGQGTAYIQARGATESQRRLAPAPVFAVQVPSNQGKEFRFDEISPMIEAGEVYLPEDAGWLDLFVREVGQFPDGPHDDQVDAMTQALRWFKSQRRRYGAKKFKSFG